MSFSLYFFKLFAKILYTIQIIVFKFIKIRLCMLNENIRVEEQGFNQRDVIAYRFSKIFDEQFTNEVLNEYSNGEWSSRLASDSEDKKHTDLFIKNKNRLYRCDCKARCDDFYLGNSKISEPFVLSIGEYALHSNMTDCISFFGPDGNLYICSLSEIRDNVKPCAVRDSKGFNGHKQTLYIYKVYDLINIPSTIRIEVPDDVKGFYNNSYEIYNKYRNEFFRMKSLNRYDMLPGIVERFENELRDVIHNYRNYSIWKDEVVDTSSNIDDNLNEVYNLLGV